MDQNTPLTEVASHLSVGAAGFLGEQHPVIQTSVLNVVRHTITRFEQSGIVFDPMTYQAVIDQMVASVAGAFNASAAYAVALDRMRTIALSGPEGPDMLRQILEVLHGR